MYEYDVFISYRRTEAEDLWLKQHFVRNFVHFLSNAYPGAREPKFFFDQLHVSNDIRTGRLAEGSGIEPGRRWQDQLEAGIRKSRCILGLWSLPYFRSRWCQIEWRSFSSRPGEPLVVANLHPRQRFPPEAKDVETVDISEFTLIGTPLSEGRLEKGFRDALRQLADQVVNRLDAVPPYQDWPISSYDKQPEPLHIPLTTFAKPEQVNG